jgi:hypothetical protein
MHSSTVIIMVPLNPYHLKNIMDWKLLVQRHWISTHPSTSCFVSDRLSARTGKDAQGF